MYNFRPQVPLLELFVVSRLCQIYDQGCDSQGKRGKEDGLVAQHRGYDDEAHQRHDEAEGVQEAASSHQTLLVAGLESSHSKRR